MKATFKTKNRKEVLRLANADNMANFIWELVHNGWRAFKETDYEYEKAWSKINELLEEHHIDIDALTD